MREPLGEHCVMSIALPVAECARASLAECLSGALAALDGFPVGQLLDVYIAALEGGSTPPDRAATFIDCIFGCWITGLRTEIEILTPASTDRMAKARQRLADTRGALVSVQAQLRKLERLRTEVPGEGRPSAYPSRAAPWARWQVRRFRKPSHRVARMIGS